MNRFLLALFASLAVFLVPACATPAHADLTDDAYVSVLHEEGITGRPADLIRMGHAVCDLRDEGWSSMRIAREIADVNDDMSLSDGAYLVGAAQAAYCPEHETGASA